MIEIFKADDFLSATSQSVLRKSAYEVAAVCAKDANEKLAKLKVGEIMDISIGEVLNLRKEVEKLNAAIVARAELSVAEQKPRTWELSKLEINKIVSWLEETRDSARDSFKAEPNKNSNHLATAYLAEAELCDRLLEFIRDK